MPIETCYIIAWVSVFVTLKRTNLNNVVGSGFLRFCIKTVIVIFFTAVVTISRNTDYPWASCLSTLLIINYVIWVVVFLNRSPFAFSSCLCFDIDETGLKRDRENVHVQRFINDDPCTFIEMVEDQRDEYYKYIEDMTDKYRNNPLRSRQLSKWISEHPGPTYRFRLFRYVTKYKTENYVKTSYREKVYSKYVEYTYENIKKLYSQLEEIDFEYTLPEAHTLDQRKAMSPSLRKEIMIRDHYTCQICGKYMPDEVGLHIDHIIPISKGGKTVESNLQVLCSKCNGEKSNKY